VAHHQAIAYGIDIESIAAVIAHRQAPAISQFAGDNVGRGLKLVVGGRGGARDGHLGQDTHQHNDDEQFDERESTTKR
jgi:hypothetical protein